MSSVEEFSYDELLCLQRITELILNEENLDNALKSTLNILSEKMGLKRGIVSIYQKDLNEIHHDTFGFEKNSADIIKFAPGEGITGEVVKTGRPIAIPQLDKAPVFLDKTGIRKKLDRKELAFICVPIKYMNETIGALSVDRTIKDEEDDLSHEVDFLSKIAERIAEIVKKKILFIENQQLKEMIQKSNPLGTIIGNSKGMRDLAYQVSLISDKPISVLVTGETGTGKELVAKHIHNMSNRKNKPFITVNCGAIPEGLIESELFGHKKGAFTGAISDRIGKFEAANEGTLFLDEIAELPPLLQVKLLRALQEREICRVGDNNPISVDTRIITATNRDLDAEIEKGNFRADLYYRINVFHLYLPTLKERGADIVLLTDYFIKKYSSLLNKKIERIDTPAIDMLVNYHWPGNVRELENCIERACLLTTDNVIHSHHLPPSLQMKTTESINKTKGKFESLVKSYEIELITDALKDSNGNQTKAATFLGTSKRVIQYKIDQYGIDYQRFRKKKR